MLRNKRFILANSSDGTANKVQLWSAETGRVVKTWKAKTFQQVLKIVSETYDMP